MYKEWKQSPNAKIYEKSKKHTHSCICIVCPYANLIVPTKFVIAISGYAIANTKA